LFEALNHRPDHVIEASVRENRGREREYDPQNLSGDGVHFVDIAVVSF